MREFGQMIINETRKRILIAKDCKFVDVARFIIIGMLYFAIALVIGEGHLINVNMYSLLIGYIVWCNALLVFSKTSSELSEEAKSGMLEQMCMGVMPLWGIVLGRMLILWFFTTVEVGILGILLAVLCGLPIVLSEDGLLAFLFTQLGILGFDFVIAGETILFRKSGVLASSLFEKILLFINGSILSLDQYPYFLQIVFAQLPTTQGITVLRKVLLDGQSFVLAGTDATTVALLSNSIGYFLGGICILILCLQVATRKGTIGNY